MKIVLFALVLIACSQASVGQAQEAIVDTGKMILFKAGKEIGSETFSIKNLESAESRSALNIDGNAINFKTATEYSGTQPKSFNLAQEPNGNLFLTVTGDRVKVTGVKEATGEIDPSALILENLVWHQFYFLLKRYDAEKAGIRHFTAFVPSQMANVPATVELKETAAALEGLPVKLNHYQIVFQSLLLMNIWADPEGKLVYISVPNQSLEAVRQEYAKSIDAIRKGLAETRSKSRVAIDYSVPADAPFTAEEVTVQAKGHTLAGTLLLPKTGSKPLPAVITITGSGQQTRDEPIPIPGLEKYQPFRQIAEALAGKGIAVLRVDDRGVGKSTGLAGLNEATTFDFADDTRAQVAYLRTRSEIDPDRIGLIGHSEGGIIAPLVASTDPKIAAIVLLAGTAKTGERVILDQSAFALDGNINTTQEDRKQALQKQREMLTAAMAGNNDVSVPEQMRLPWYVAFLKYDPLPTIEKVRQPILILQGEFDQQVTADQAPMLEKAAREAGNKDVTVKVFPKLNHLFLPSKTGAFSEYGSLQVTTLGQDVTDTIADWFQQKLKSELIRR